MRILQIDQIAVNYAGVRALRGVSLCLEEGRIHGLIGPNGAGKSTVIDAISGRCRIAAGTVVLQGHDVTHSSVVERRRLGMSRSFQRTSIFDGLTVHQQVLIAAQQLGNPDADVDTIEVLSELELINLSHIEARYLGYGQQRRLDVALALVGQPRLLLLDEPMAGLSIEESLTMARHLQQIVSRRKMAVLLVEHDMDVVFGICQQITVFELGEVIAQGTPIEIRANPRVREAYLGSAA